MNNIPRQNDYDCYNNNQPMVEPPEPKNITNDLNNIRRALNEIETIAEIMLNKIDGNTSGAVKCAPTQGCESVCIAETLERMKEKAECIYYRLDRINGMI